MTDPNGSKDEVPVPESGVRADLPDEELMALPARPRKRGRNPLFMIAVVILTILVLRWYRYEVMYFFASSTPTDLGSVMDLDASKFRSNTYVTVEAWPNPTKVVKYQKRMSKGAFRMFAVVGQKKLLVQSFTPKGQKDTVALEGDELRTTYTGRLVAFGDLESSFATRSGYVTVRKFFHEKLFVEVGSDSFLLMDGDEPRSYWAYLVLAIVMAGFGIVNAVMLVLNVRARLRDGRNSPTRS